MAKVHEENTDALKGFAKRGFEVFASGEDPKEGYPVLFMRASLHSHFPYTNDQVCEPECV
jgi:hypothetical protein